LDVNVKANSVMIKIWLLRARNSNMGTAVRRLGLNKIGTTDPRRLLISTPPQLNDEKGRDRDKEVGRLWPKDRLCAGARLTGPA
jgi:hypothetical protein